MLGLCCCVGFSLVAGSGGYAPVAMHWLLMWWLLLLQSVGSRVPRLQYLQLPGSRAQAQWLWHVDLVSLRPVGSSWARDQTHVSCTGKWILYH